MTALLDIRSAEVKGRTVLIRADLNVPMLGSRITDLTRIRRFAPTVRDLVSRGAKVVVMTHLGRPAHEANPICSTRPLARALADEIGQDVIFVPDCVGSVAEHATGRLQPGEVALLENLRFHKGEEANDRSFAIRLSVNGDIYVNDAFSCAHRAHASTAAIASLMPSFAGPSLIAEVEALERALENPARPVAALVGGAKVSTKIGLLGNLIPKMDYLIIGGGMANTFLAALGHDVGRSLVEKDAIPVALDALAVAKANRCAVILPDDVAAAREFKADADRSIVGVGAIPPDSMVLDAGPETVRAIKSVLQTCRTLLWNGPLGAFELPPFDTATKAVAHAAATMTEQGRLVTIAGGGDTAAALNGCAVADRFTYVSTAGGAFLEWIEGKTLPGIRAIQSGFKIVEEV